MSNGRSEVVTRQVVCVSKEVIKCIQCSFNFLLLDFINQPNTFPLLVVNNFFLTISFCSNSIFSKLMYSVELNLDKVDVTDFNYK